MKYIVKLKMKYNLDDDNSYYKSFELCFKYKKMGSFFYTYVLLFYHTEARTCQLESDKRTFMERIEDSINEICNMTDEKLIDMIKDKIIQKEGIIQSKLDKENKAKDLANKLNEKINRLKKFEIEI